jgi:RNA polymerase sigma factor (sigma-70 family)
MSGDPKSAPPPTFGKQETQLPDAGAADGASIIAEMRPALVKYFERKCGVPAEAEDLAQDVLLRALGHVVWKTPEQAKGYIFRAAVNRWHDRRRRALTHGRTVQWDEDALSAAGALESISNEEIAPERVLKVEQELFHVATALLELSERCQDVFVLVRLEGMKQHAVAETLGISVSTVEKELVKALAHLARCASRWDGTS